VITGQPPPQQEEKLELKMTGMVDVVFHLLIFFIVTLRIPREEGMIETELPRAKGTGEVSAVQEQRRQEFEDVLLHIARDPQSGRVRTYVSNQLMRTPEQLLGRLKLFHDLNEQGRVVVKCEDDVPYQHLVEAISLVRAAGLPMAFADL